MASESPMKLALRKASTLNNASSNPLGPDPYDNRIEDPPRQPDPRATRRPSSTWDRVRIIVVLGILWLGLFWSLVNSNPFFSVADSARLALRSYAWVIALASLETIRQLHYVIAENSAGYHHFWKDLVFGRVERRSASMDDWTRFRLARVAKLVIPFALLIALMSAIWQVPPAQAVVMLPRLFESITARFVILGPLFFVLIVQFLGAFWFLSRVGREIYMPEDIKTRFTDVWGQDRVLERVRENILFLEAPDAIESKGGHVPGGILLWGPPGTGKTLMAEAVAGESGRPFVLSDVGAMNGYFAGMGVIAVKGLFRKVRKLALRHGGVVVFLDEADALGSRGSAVASKDVVTHPWSQGCNGMSFMSPQGLSAVAAIDGSFSPEPPRTIRDRMFLGAGGGGSGGAIQALLTELSGLSKPRGFINKHVRRAFGFRPKPPPKFRILVILATNMPDVLDPALMRPGRIDRIYKVGYPSKAGRIRTYDGYLSKIRHDVTADQVEKLATITPYATGATIKDLVNEALINSIREGRDWVTWKDIIQARLLKQLGPPEDVEYIERERHATAIHEAAHAVVAYRIRRHMTIDIATIEKGQSYLGMVQSIPLEEQFTNWRSEYEADLMVGLAGIAGERMFFDGDQSSGVSGDLHSATTLALAMEGYWGMGSTLGAHSATKAKIQNIHVSAEDGVDRSVLESKLGNQVEVRLNDVYRRTWRLLEQNRKEVLAVAHALETHKTLTGDDVGAVIEGRMGTLIDGTPYGDDEFIHMAERYHESALAAHRDHAPIASDLPIMTARNGSAITNYRAADRSELGDD